LGEGIDSHPRGLVIGKEQERQQQQMQQVSWLVNALLSI
jgi:hypothetical protein